MVVGATPTAFGAPTPRVLRGKRRGVARPQQFRLQSAVPVYRPRPGAAAAVVGHSRQLQRAQGQMGRYWPGVLGVLGVLARGARHGYLVRHFAIRMHPPPLRKVRDQLSRWVAVGKLQVAWGSQAVVPPPPPPRISTWPGGGGGGYRRGVLNPLQPWCTPGEIPQLPQKPLRLGFVGGFGGQL